MRCPRCGGDLTERPATSRVDNETRICPACGMREALWELDHPNEELPPLTERIES